MALDLREAIGDPVRRAFLAIGLGNEFGIVTAFNPRGENLDDAVNQQRQSELEAELVSIGLPFVRVDCCSPDQRHCECSVAVVAPRDVVIDIARRWNQIAIFWWDGAKFWLYGVTISGMKVLP